MGTVTVRDARDDERDAIAALTLGAYGEYASLMAPAAWGGLEQAVRAALASDQGAERIVAFDGDALLGSVMLFPAAADAYGGLTGGATCPEVRLLAVAPQARGRGIGQLLVDECVRRAQRAGATELGLHTSRSMRSAMRLYERMGFVRAPERDFRPEGAELVEGYRLVLAEHPATEAER